jgi:branched-chain amino acid aminotransferase
VNHNHSPCSALAPAGRVGLALMQCELHLANNTGTQKDLHPTPVRPAGWFSLPRIDGCPRELISMQVFLNGRFVPEAQAVVPITDRGFLYGDGLFETMRVSSGRVLWWGRHMERLQRGVDLLKLQLPWQAESLLGFAAKLIAQNEMSESLLRITLTRGSGPRGYSVKNATCPTLAMTLHPLPAVPSSVRLTTASQRIPAHDPAANCKTANKLAQILARAEAEGRGADEALLLNTDGNVCEAASGNLFWLEGGAVCTPPLSDGPLAGVTRAVVMDLCGGRNIRTIERPVRPGELFEADGVFLTNSGWGIVPASELDGRVLRQSPFIGELQAAYAELCRVEAGRPSG